MAPVFQADFLLLRANDQTRVILGEVIAAPKGGMLLENDLCTLVEYECTSPADGLLGPVRPRINPFYPKQGLQHLRVGDVKRDDILVYAVGVDYSGKGDERKIKIRHAYLQLLAAADSTFVMPAVAPGRPAPNRPGTSAAAHTRQRRPAAAANDSSNSSSEAEQDDVGEGAADDRGEEVLPHHPRVPTRHTLAGCRVFVPREAWPDETCDGEGWWGRVKRVVSETAKVLMDADGEIYDFEVGAVLTWCGGA